ncbi:hypothetical protein F2P79_002076 [Pimephales promelas]|nr:hypothetical protein F2P79_002076 [Pimephales promelas]
MIDVLQLFSPLKIPIPQVMKTSGMKTLKDGGQRGALRLRGSRCQRVVCGALDLITPAITGRAVRPWCVTPLLRGRRCGGNRMWRNLEGSSMLYHLERLESVLHLTPGECVISFWSEA